MPTAQLLGLFGHERDENGVPKLPPEEGRELSPREMFRSLCWHQGITDRATQDQLWKDELRRLAD